ncbi:hypothetical protein A2U01_0085403, partial [Trifolium medium]|nr:hypothetical protein [Trifolium medium]
AIQQDGNIAVMGTWDNNIWSWKLDWTVALNETDAELARDLHELIVQVGPNSNSSDRRKWKPNSVGLFSVRSAYEVQQSLTQTAPI